MKLNDVTKFLAGTGWVDDLIIISCLIIPGFWFLYFQKIDEFKTFDWFRLILLSAIYSLPSFMIVDTSIRLSMLRKVAEKMSSSALEVDFIARREIKNLMETKMQFASPAYERILEKISKYLDANFFLRKYVAFFIYGSLLGTTLFCHILNLPREIFGLNTFLTILYSTQAFISILLMFISWIVESNN